MPEVTITVRRNGSLKIDGPFSLIGSDGVEIPLPPLKEGKTAYSFCRCGASKNKPFCDSSHKLCNFDGTEAHILEREKLAADH
ncbi:MAG: CDGSH iron-sulfur domain-containing protein [Terriglobales bacterium]